MPNWLDRDAVVVGMAVWSTVVAPAAVLWLGKYFARRQVLERYVKAHAADHDDLDRRLAAGDARFTRLEASLANLPTKDESHALKVEMTRLSGDIRVISAVLQRVEGPVRDLVTSALAEGIGK